MNERKNENILITDSEPQIQLHSCIVYITWKDFAKLPASSSALNSRRQWPGTRGDFWAEPMIGENWQLIIDEPVEFEKKPAVEVQDCKKITGHFRGIFRIYPNLIKENRRMWTSNRLDLQTLGSQPVMPNNLPDHWAEPVEILVFAIPTGYMLTSSGYPVLNWGIFYRFL